MTHIQGLYQELPSLISDVDAPPPVEGVVAESPAVTDQSGPAEVDHDPSDEPAPESTWDVDHQVPPLDADWWANGVSLHLVCAGCEVRGGMRGGVEGWGVRSVTDTWDTYECWCHLSHLLALEEEMRNCTLAVTQIALMESALSRHQETEQFQTSPGVEGIG